MFWGCTMYLMRNLWSLVIIGFAVCAPTPKRCQTSTKTTKQIDNDRILGPPGVGLRFKRQVMEDTEDDCFTSTESLISPSTTSEQTHRNTFIPELPVTSVLPVTETPMGHSTSEGRSTLHQTTDTSPTKNATFESSATATSPDSNSVKIVSTKPESDTNTTHCRTDHILAIVFGVCLFLLLLVNILYIICWWRRHRDSVPIIENEETGNAMHVIKQDQRVKTID